MRRERYNGRRIDGKADDGKPKLTPAFAFAKLREAAFTTALAVLIMVFLVYASP